MVKALIGFARWDRQDALTVGHHDVFALSDDLKPALRSDVYFVATAIVLRRSVTDKPSAST